MTQRPREGTRPPPKHAWEWVLGGGIACMADQGCSAPQGGPNLPCSERAPFPEKCRLVRGMWMGSADRSSTCCLDATKSKKRHSWPDRSCSGAAGGGRRRGRPSRAKGGHQNPVLVTPPHLAHRCNRADSLLTNFKDQSPSFFFVQSARKVHLWRW